MPIRTRFRRLAIELAIVSEESWLGKSIGNNQTVITHCDRDTNACIFHIRYHFKLNSRWTYILSSSFCIQYLFNQQARAAQPKAFIWFRFVKWYIIWFRISWYFKLALATVIFKKIRVCGCVCVCVCVLCFVIFFYAKSLEKNKKKR